jgi:hypothetical protein
MNGRNYDLLLGRMTTIANRHESLKQQLEAMTCEEVQKILNERRNLKISTRLENYEEALKLNPLATPKVTSVRRPPETIQKARDLKWSAVASRSVSHVNASIAEESFARDSSPEVQEHPDRGADVTLGRFGGKSSPAPRQLHRPRVHAVSKSLPPEANALPTVLPALAEETLTENARIHIDFDRLQRTTAIESIRLELQKEQLKRIQHKFDSIKSFPGYHPPPTTVYSDPQEQLPAPWRSKVLHARAGREAREKKPWALPQPLHARRKKKAVVEDVVEECRVVEVEAVAPIKSAMELMLMGMDHDNDDENDSEGSQSHEAEQQQQQQHTPLPEEHDAAIQKPDPHELPVNNEAPATSVNDATQQAEEAKQGDPTLADAERPATSASASSDVDSVFTRDSEVLLTKKAVVCTGEANNSIIMGELPPNVDFEDILLEKVLSGEEIYKISTKGHKKLRNGDLFLLGRFLRGDVMLVPESYQESDSSGGDDDEFPAITSRGNSRGGARSHGSNSKSRSRSRPSTRDGDVAFMMASDFVQVPFCKHCYYVHFFMIVTHASTGAAKQTRQQGQRTRFPRRRRCRKRRRSRVCFGAKTPRRR